MEPGWDDDLPPRATRNPLTAVVAVLLVIALVASVVVIALDKTDDRDHRRAPEVHEDLSSVSVPTGPPPTETELALAVKEISAFVAETRGLEFEHPVPVKLLDDAAFSARVEKDAVDDAAELDETENVLKALNLLDDDVHLADVLTSFLGDGVVGFYDTETEELVLRGATLTPYVRTTLAHELTHALDDQHFELYRPQLDKADDETGFAFSSLVEGNAVRVEDAYKRTLTKEERAQAAAEEARLGAGLDLSSIPRVLPELIGFPYAFGPAMAEALAAAGGEARVNEAFGDPPVTSEQVLDPKRWLAGQAEPVAVAPPKADGEVFDQGVLGLWGLVLLLEDELGQQNAFTDAEGWGGDWYVAWRQGEQTCVRATFVMDTDKDLKELASGLDDWAAAQDDADVERGDGQVTFRSCG